MRPSYSIQFSILHFEHGAFTSAKPLETITMLILVSQWHLTLEIPVCYFYKASLLGCVFHFPLCSVASWIFAGSHDRPVRGSAHCGAESSIKATQRGDCSHSDHCCCRLKAEERELQENNSFFSGIHFAAHFTVIESNL